MNASRIATTGAWRPDQLLDRWISCRLYGSILKNGKNETPKMNSNKAPLGIGSDVVGDWHNQQLCFIVSKPDLPNIKPGREINKKRANLCILCPMDPPCWVVKCGCYELGFRIEKQTYSTASMPHNKFTPTGVLIGCGGRRRRVRMSNPLKTISCDRVHPEKPWSSHGRPAHCASLIKFKLYTYNAFDKK